MFLRLVIKNVISLLNSILYLTTKKRTGFCTKAVLTSWVSFPFQVKWTASVVDELYDMECEDNSELFPTIPLSFVPIIRLLAPQFRRSMCREESEMRLRCLGRAERVRLLGWENQKSKKEQQTDWTESAYLTHKPEDNPREHSDFQQPVSRLQYVSRIILRVTSAEPLCPRSPELFDKCCSLLTSVFQAWSHFSKYLSPKFLLSNKETH